MQALKEERGLFRGGGSATGKERRPNMEKGQAFACPPRFFRNLKLWDCCPKNSRAGLVQSAGLYPPLPTGTGLPPASQFISGRPGSYPGPILGFSVPSDTT